jgi:DNA-binding NtrC family response regulator
MVAAEDTVVVIEDDHHISDLVAMYLRRDGFRVLQADEAESVLALVDRILAPCLCSFSAPATMKSIGCWASNWEPTIM